MYILSNPHMVHTIFRCTCNCMSVHRSYIHTMHIHTLNLCKYYKKACKLIMLSTEILHTQSDKVSKWSTSYYSYSTSSLRKSSWSLNSSIYRYMYTLCQVYGWLRHCHYCAGTYVCRW